MTATEYRRIALLPLILWGSIVLAQTWRVVGSQMPDMIVYDLEGNSMNLSSLWAGKPVLLISGSLSCPPSRKTLPGTSVLLDEYKDRLNVAVLYVIDAHPVGDPSPYSGEERVKKKNVKQGISIRQPTSQEERIARASELQKLLGSSAPIVVDNMENTGWASVGKRPNTAVLISTKGTVLAQQKWFDDVAIRDMIERHLGSKH